MAISDVKAEIAEHGPSPAREARLRQAEAALATFNARQPAIHANNQKLIGRKVATDDVVHACQGFVAKRVARGEPFRDARPKIEKKANHRWGDVAEAFKETRRELISDYQDVTESLRPPDEVVAKGRGLPAKWAETLSVEIDINGNLQIDFPHQPFRAEPSTAGIIPRAFDARALIAWLAPEKLADEIERQIRAAYEGSSALILTAAEKRTRLRQIEAEMLQTERLECEAIWRGLEAGEDLHFRGDTDPRAVLGIA